MTVRRRIGPWSATALVVGNMIGSGVYLLPASLAPLGWNAVLGWLATIAGSLCLAYTFARLARSFPAGGGPYVYAREAFGPVIAFMVAWSYWISLWTGNAALAVAVTASLSAIMPVLGAQPAVGAAVTLGVVWLLTGVNCLGTGTAGRVQLVLTVIKLLPLLAVLGLGAWLVAGGHARLPPLDVGAIGVAPISAAATLTVWAFLGLESATVPGEDVEAPDKTIPRATLIGTALAGAVYLLACSAVNLLLPADVVAASSSPFATFVAAELGDAAGLLVAGFAALSAFGALNGWILLQGEMPRALAENGVFPRQFARRSARGTPVRAHLLSSSCITVMVLASQSGTLGRAFTFLLLVATCSSLVLYLVCALAAFRLNRLARLGDARLLPPVALLAVAFSAWTIIGAGREAVLWGAALLVAGLPVYVLVRRTARLAEGKPL